MDSNNIKKALQLRDRVVRVISADGMFRAVCVKNTATAYAAQQRHKLDNIPALLLARTLAGASLIAAFLKGEERVILEADGAGPVSKVFAEVMQLGEARGFVNLRNPDGQISVSSLGEALGAGLMKVSRILYNKSEPVQGIVPLHAGDISTDLAHYFLQSEQIPTAVMLDADFDEQGIIKQSGGLIVQAMPGHTQEQTRQIYAMLTDSERLTKLFEEGMTPLQCLQKILPFEFQVINSAQIDFFCRCSKDTFLGKILTLGKNVVEEMQKENQNELVCKYCNEHYYLSQSDYDRLLEELTAMNN